MEHPNIFLTLRKYFLLKIIFLQVSMFFDLAQNAKIDDISELKRHADFTVKILKNYVFEVQLVVLLVN